jgi:hypothetical protein
VTQLSLEIKSYDYATGKSYKEVVSPSILGMVRRNAKDTSVEAAESIVPHLGHLHSLVLGWFLRVGSGTDEELVQSELSSQYGPNTLRPRRIELVSKGLLRDSGRRRKNSRNRNMIVWEPTEKL